MARKYDVLVAGDYFLDLIFSELPAFPELGREIVGSGFEMIPGGAYNSAIAMHRLGLKVGWAADFGDDDFSRFALDRAAGEGLDDALFVRHNRPMRRITVSLSYPADRAFVTYCDREPAVPAAIKALPTVSARAFYLPGLYAGPLFDAGLALLRAKRMKLIMDGNSSGAISLSDAAVRRAVRSADIFMPNADEVRRMTGETDLRAGLAALAALCPVVVVKAGAQGAYACRGRELLHTPAIPVTPVDTTGAGDCFNAGFVKAWLDGRPLAECLRWGAVVGGLSTLARGGTGQVIAEADVLQWLGQEAGRVTPPPVSPPASPSAR